MRHCPDITTRTRLLRRFYADLIAQHEIVTNFGADNRGLQVGQSFAPINTQIHLPPERHETPPLPCSTVPFRRDPNFVDRPELDELHQKLSSPAARVALVGLGGVGYAHLGGSDPHIYTGEEDVHVFRKASNRMEKVLGKQDPLTLASASILVLALWRRGQYEEAEILNRNLLEESKKVLGKEHPDTLESVFWQGVLLRDQERYEEAEDFFRRALAGMEKVLGKEHPKTLRTLRDLVTLLRRQGKYEEAEQMQRVLAARKTLYGEQQV